MEENVTSPPLENQHKKIMVKLPNVISKILPKFLLVLAVLALVGAGYWGYKNYIRTRLELSEYKDDPNVIAFKEKYDLIGKVSNHVMLPANEDPTVATITNAHRLAGQPFFSHAQNGDKVIIFPLAGRAILYRPGVDKIIEAAPVNITDMEKSVNTDAITKDKDQEEVEEVSQSTPSEVLGEEDEQEARLVQISVLNGTEGVAGLASDTADLISDTYADREEFNIEIINIDNAVDVFSYTLIYYQEEQDQALASELAELLDGRVTTQFPENEAEFNGDILIIRGQ